MAMNQLNRGSASPPPKKGGKEKEGEKKDAKKGVRFKTVVLFLVCVLPSPPPPSPGSKLATFCLFCI